MSSAPPFLDPREYAYQSFNYVPADNSSHQLSTYNQWLVTKVQIFAGTTPITFFFNESPSPALHIAANGCAVFEPNGGYRGDISMLGDTDSLMLVEFWYQTNPVGPIAVAVF